MKVYEAVFEEGVTEGVYALSVVENPAMQDFWITLSEHPHKVEFAQVDEEKRLLLGAALIPNKKVYRNINGNEFYITFSEETIEKLAHSFFKKQHNNNSSLEHEIKLNGMSVVEAWTVQDPNNDKSNAYGKTYEKGTWVTMMKVDNDEVWQKVKNGEVKGFSIDGLLGLKETNLKTDIEMTEEVQKSIVDNVIDGVKALFNTNKEPEVTPEPEKPIEQIEVKAMEEPMEEKSLDKDEMMNELKAYVDAELAKALGSKDEKIEELETELKKQSEELQKQPEVEPTVVKDVETVNVGFKSTATTKTGRILETLSRIKK